MRTFKGKVSKATSRDPSKTKGLVDRYDKKLTKLINKLRKDIIVLLNQTARGGDIRDMRTRQLAKLDLKVFKDKLNRVIKANWEEPAQNAGKQAINKQIQAGKARADQFLSTLNITAMISPDFLPDQRVFDVLHERNLTEIMGIGQEIEKRLVEQISEGVLKGEGINKLSKRITEQTDMAKSRATRVARTETLNAFNKAATQRYKKHGIEKVKWRVGGSNICTNVKGFDGKLYSGGCLGLNGQVFDINEAPPQPLHPNCKCITQPVIEEVR